MSERIAVLVMAYGGPNNLEEVEPYLLDVSGGRPLPPRAVEAIKRRYEQIGGRSPILENTQAQAAALQKALGDRFRVFIGMRNWYPYIREAVDEIVLQGFRRLIGIAMAPHYSKVSVGAYAASLEEAIAAQRQPPEIEMIASWKDDPGLLETLQAHIQEGLDRFPAARRPGVHLIFTAHSLPMSIVEQGDPYPEELQVTVRELQRRFPSKPSHFAYQSAGMSGDAWLGPDAGELLADLTGRGVEDFLIVPVGFVTEHVEILYDVDIEMRKQVEAAGGRLERIEMPGAAPRLMGSLARYMRGLAIARGWL